MEFSVKAVAQRNSVAPVLLLGYLNLAAYPL